MNKHSKFSPSFSHTWLKCSASLTYKSSSRIPNEYALQGIKAHEVFEYYVKEKIKGTENVYEKTLKIYEDKEMVEHASKFYNRYSNLFNYGDIGLSTSGNGSGYIIEQEKKVVLEEDKDLFGTVDFLIYNDDEVHVIDLKYGKQKVNVENNNQLLIYATCAKSMLKLNTQKKFYICIYQPRINYVGQVEYSREQMEEYHNYLINNLKRVKSELNTKPVYNPGDAQCKYCPGKVEKKCFQYMNFLRIRDI